MPMQDVDVVHGTDPVKVAEFMAVRRSLDARVRGQLVLPILLAPQREQGEANE
jgi:hypothetical protein